jgi:hypothetical protein
MLDSLTDFHEGGEKFTLPSKLVRYIEFEKVVVFLLDENGKRDKIVGVKFITSMEGGGVNHYYIAWEFQIIDGFNKTHRINFLEKENHKGVESVHCHGVQCDMTFYLNPDTGEIIDKFIWRW